MRRLRLLVVALALATLTACVLDFSGLWGQEDGGRDGRGDDSVGADITIDRFEVSGDHLSDQHDGPVDLFLDRDVEDRYDRMPDIARDFSREVESTDAFLADERPDFRQDILPDRFLVDARDADDGGLDQPREGLPDRPVGDCRPIDEICNNFDDDCDGDTDEDLGSTTCGVGACVRIEPNCFEGRPNACIPGPPALVEDCRSAVDDDCNGLANERDAMSCVRFHYDFDGDGYSVRSDVYQCWCAPTGLYRAVTGHDGDCDDRRDSVYPGAPEVCGNSIDDDCDAYTDEDC